MRLFAVIILFLSACAEIDSVIGSPQFSSNLQGQEYLAMSTSTPQARVNRRGVISDASLWNGGPQSLLGDRRAISRGDILTVVIEINDKAEISNSSSRKRSSEEKLAIPSLLGIPQRINSIMVPSASLDTAVSTTAGSSSAGDGSVRRKEKLTLRVAATIVEVLNNGVLRIEGSQEVRVNFEIRELLVSGYIRPKDISRQNEITYDKIASARISYGGRGMISDAQQPRYGQRLVDKILPF